MSVRTSPAFADQVLALMKSRRVCRSFTDEPVSDEHLRMLTEAARWATSGGNRHLHKFLIVRDPETIRRVRSVSPGMQASPPAMIVILTDLEVAARESLQMEHDQRQLDGCRHGGDEHDEHGPRARDRHLPSDILQPVRRRRHARPAAAPDPGVDSHRRPPETRGARHAGRCAETPAGT